MSIIDYATLRSAVLSYAARTDSRFTAMVPTFVGLCEQRLYDGGGKPGDDVYTPPLRSRTMEVSTTVALTAGQGTWPEDVLEVRKIARSGDMEGLTYITPERMSVERARYPSSGLPLYYTVSGSTLSAVPAGDATLALDYYAQYDAVTDTSPDGPLITAHGLIYLELTLFEAFAWMQEPELAVAHLAKGRAMIEGANARAQAARTPGPMRIRPRRVIGA